MSELTATEALRGSEFIYKNGDFESSFCPEDFNEEQKMVADAIQNFTDTRVLPNLKLIEKQDPAIIAQLITEAGDLGLFAANIPEEYGGLNLDTNTNMVMTEYIGAAPSFSVTVAAHTGIGILPIFYFGTEAQKAKYLPALAAGQMKASYCLTEPNAGSDALSARTKAILTEDGSHYSITGQKMWITNAGFADVFIVFAKIDGEKFTGFIVERGYEGVTLGAEELKLGMKGSSTRQVFFENVKVPVENLLGEIGKGHKIAFNILNIGRIKLAAGVLGGAKMANTYGIRYANERKQFGKNIASFGAIQHKLAEQALRIYVTESAMYRTSRDIDRMEKSLEHEGKSLGEALLGAAEEYAIECAILKVRGSECLDYVVDESLQIYGGMGYSEEAPAAAAYRDARINRIYEGTNEINRMLAVDMLLKRSLKGHIDLFTPAMAIQKELTSMPAFETEQDGYLAKERKMVRQMKKAFLAVAGATAQNLMQELEHEQEILMNLSDMMAEIYLCESAVLRTLKRIQYLGIEHCETSIQMTQVYVNDAMERLAQHGRAAVAAWADGDMKRVLLMAIKRFTKFEPINTKDLRRKIAAHLITCNEYEFRNKNK